MKKLTPNFMAELFKLMYLDINITRIATVHLSYQLIPKEWIGFKFLLREALEQFNRREAVPSLGVAAQKFINNEDVQETIDEIKSANMVDKELIIDQLESFIKETEFELLSRRVHDLYEEGKKEEAIRVNAEESKRILEISLRKTGGNFVQVWGGFKERMKAKRNNPNSSTLTRKVAFGIDKLDVLSYGGAEPGDTCLWIMRSGIGKALSLDSDIMTPSGVIKMRDIKVGDTILGFDGKPQSVIAIPYRGIDDCYRVTFSDGTFVDCNKEHLWKVKSINFDWSVVSLRSFLSLYRETKIYILSYKDKKETYISSIEYIGKREQQCITVSNPDGLFLTNDFIVTHNSTSLRWHGFCAALEGEPVLHIQLEGGVEACVDKYDQMWTAQSYMDIRQGNIKAEDEAAIMKTCEDMKNFGQDISVYGFKKFGEASMNDVRERCYEFQKIFGKFPRLVILDSLDLVASGVSKKIDNDPEFLKQKLQKNAQLFKDLMVEINAVGITATQASNVPIEIWNNPEKVIDRSYTEGDKTLVKPFSFVFTGNMTVLEKKEKRMRIYIDKLRDYKESQLIFTIATEYDKGKFYNRKKTMATYYDNDPATINKDSEKEKLAKGKSTRNKATSV